MNKLDLFIKIFTIVIIFTFAALFLAVSVNLILAHMILTASGTSKNVADDLWLRGVNIYLGFSYLYTSAFIEELIFRLIPLGICMAFSESRRFWPIVALISSVVFGWVHGNWINILIQGTVGFILCLVFAIINKEGEKNAWVKAVMTSALVHTMYNLIIVYFA